LNHGNARAKTPRRFERLPCWRGVAIDEKGARAYKARDVAAISRPHRFLATVSRSYSFEDR